MFFKSLALFFVDQRSAVGLIYFMIKRCWMLNKLNIKSNQGILFLMIWKKCCVSDTFTSICIWDKEIMTVSIRTFCRSPHCSQIPSCWIFMCYIKVFVNLLCFLISQPQASRVSSVALQQNWCWLPCFYRIDFHDIQPLEPSLTDNQIWKVDG